MAYRATYKQRVKFDSEKTRSTYSTLEAKFRFRREVAPKDRGIIRKRINDLLNEAKKEIRIPERFFLEERDYLESYGYISRNFIFDKRSLGFDVYYISSKIMDKSAIQLDAINRYILTGEEKKE